MEDDHLQRSWRLMFGIKEYSDRWARGEFCRGEKWNGMYILLYALFFPTTWEEELPRDSVTRAQLVDWARVAYLERLGAEYPPEERERDGRRHQGRALSVQARPQVQGLVSCVMNKLLPAPADGH